jgi:apurinic endonuclease APN1
VDGQAAFIVCASHKRKLTAAAVDSSISASDASALIPASISASETAAAEPGDTQQLDVAVRKQKKLSKAQIAALQPFTQPPPKHMYIGAHVSASGGPTQAVYNAAAIGARAFALFTRSRGRWDCSPLTDEEAVSFRETLARMGYSPQHVVPHASYLINPGCPIPQQLEKSREGMLDEVRRCEKLGLSLYNFHPGSSRGLVSTEECIQIIADTINLVHRQTSGVCLLLENTASLTNGIGGTFEQLAAIIEKVEDKSRIGICLDTCHAFAAGYDLSTREGYEETMGLLDAVVGFPYLKAMHINDSKTPLGSGKDRHECIGHGEIGLKMFEFIATDTRLQHIPLILETPDLPGSGEGKHQQKEIELLYSFVRQ